MNNSDTNPIILYLVVNSSLNMSIGKTAAQCCHAVQMIMTSYYHYSSIMDEIGEIIEDDEPDVNKERQIKVMSEWLYNGSYAKVVLEADKKEWQKLKTELANEIFLVKDNGLTELSPGSETVIGLFPMHKSQRPKIIKRLQLLK